MKISQLIERLSDIEAHHGSDLDCVMFAKVKAPDCPESDGHDEHCFDQWEQGFYPVFPVVMPNRAGDQTSVYFEAGEY